MDELERRLGDVLVRVAQEVDPAGSRLRNPAVSTPPGRTPRSVRTYSGWAAAASAVVVAGVALGVTMAVPRSGADPAPSSSSATVADTGVPIGTADGRHPWWSLRVSQNPARGFAGLPAGKAVSAPLPHTVDPALTAARGDVPALVTATGEVRFAEPGVRSVLLLAERDAGTFVALTGTGHDGEDGLHDVRFVLVAADGTRREIYRTAQAGSAAVSPDGALLAVTRPTSVDLVAVDSGRVVHRLPGRAGPASWASDRALLSGAQDGGAGLVWRAPWTGGAEQVALGDAVALAVSGGIVTVDDGTGCLAKLDADAVVTGANCAGWRSAGQVSPDGRYVPLEWTGADGAERRGVLDVSRNQVRTWPVDGTNASWLGATDVLLREAEAEERPVTARCDLISGDCVTVPESTLDTSWRGLDWLGR